MRLDQLFEVYCALKFGLKDAAKQRFTDEERLAHLSSMKQRLNELRRSGHESEEQLTVIESSIEAFADPKKAEADFRIRFSQMSVVEREKEKESLQQGLEDLLCQSKHFTKLQRESINRRLKQVVSFDLSSLERITNQKLGKLLKRSAIRTAKDHEFLVNILADVSAPVSIEDRNRMERLVGDYELRQSRK